MKKFKNLVNNFKDLINTYLVLLLPGTMKRRAFKLFHSKELQKNFAEPELFFINEFVSPGKTVIDIGANLGLYLYAFEQSGKHKRIIGFEPIPILHKRLTKLFPDLEVYRNAVSGKNETQQFKIPFINHRAYQTRGTLENFTEEGETACENFDVECVTLDSFTEKHNVKNVGLIKIDIEGHEMNAIRGASTIIRRDQPVLMVEIEQRHHGDLRIESLFQEIMSLGYKGYFFRKGKFIDISEFSVKQHQDKGNPPYINNFLFFPLSTNVEELFSRIKL